MFSFWKPIYFPIGDVLSYAHKPGFPSDTAERMGRFVGFGESVGCALTFKILTDDTEKILYRSSIRSALTEEERRLLSTSPDRNRRAEPAGTPDFVPTPSTPTINDAPTLAEIVRSPTRDKSNGTKRHMSVIAPGDLLTRMYLTEPDETGQSFRTKIGEKIVSLEEGLEQHPDCIKFLERFEGTDCLDELVAYNQVLKALESDLLVPDEQLWSFKNIIAHEGPLTRDSPSYKGSSYNVLIAWEDGSRTFEPLKTIAADNPAVCAVDAERAKLLDTDGWKQFRRLENASSSWIGS
jgi:hypothetical protein